MDSDLHTCLGAAIAQGVPTTEILRNICNTQSRILPPAKDNVDPKLKGLGTLYAELGLKGVEAVKLGLSRKIRTTRADARNVISEWEARKLSCCFSESVESLLKLADTHLLAVSYKHEEEARWKRKGKNLIAKMSDRDQEALVNVIEGCSKIPNVKYVILWCDQVISTRQKDKGRNTLGWYNSGLVPYACLRVLKLSPHISDEILESRVWLRAERSLGRLGWGTVEVADAVSGLLGDQGEFVSVSRIMNRISGMILSGFWPKDLGYWKDDYIQMKKWALCVLSKMQFSVLPAPIFDDVEEVDNLTILSMMDEFAFVPRGLEYAEKPVHTDDRAFFLKATAWNIYTQDVWNVEKKTVSHYMGCIRLSYMFTWWASECMALIFGLLKGEDRATVILAVKDGDGYLLHRKAVDHAVYSHADQHPTEGALCALEGVARNYGLVSRTWSLLYSSSDDNDVVYTDPVLRQALGVWPTRADCLVPQVYIGLTTKLYRSAAVKVSARQTVINRFLQIHKSWNKHIREEYDNHISVTDTAAGTIWLEGFSKDKVSFGFYDYLTRGLILGESGFSNETVMLPSKWECIQEIRRIACSSSKDVQVLADEIFGSATEMNCDEFVRLKDVACFIVRGGFATCMNGLGLYSFLCSVAMHRGYWGTRVHARDGKMQIIFSNEHGDVRVAQRETILSGFQTLGLVRPEDAKAVLDVSVPIEDDAEEHGQYMYWKSMGSNTTRHQMQALFSNSVYKVDEGRHILLVDMSIVEGMEGQEDSVVDVESISLSVDRSIGYLSRALRGTGLRVSATGRVESGTVGESVLEPNIFSQEGRERLWDAIRRIDEIQERARAGQAESLRRQREILSSQNNGDSA